MIINLINLFGNAAVMLHKKQKNAKVAGCLEIFGGEQIYGIFWYLIYLSIISCYLG